MTVHAEGASHRLQLTSREHGASASSPAPIGWRDARR